MILASTFGVFYQEGRSFILDINSVDHILFIIAVCAVYLLKDWRKVGIILLAFTIGYTLSLCLAANRVINVNYEVIEYLIPVTIFITAVSNVLKKQYTFYKKNLQSNYFFALVFGIIHGFGFSQHLKSLVNDIPSFWQTFAYIVGLELAHVIVILLFLIGSYIFVNIININRRDWNLVISSAIAGIAITLMFESRYWIN